MDKHLLEVMGMILAVLFGYGIFIGIVCLIFDYIDMRKEIKFLKSQLSLLYKWEARRNNER